jgi:serine/threonine protein phosphatase 1
MSRTYAVPDLHGRYDLLCAAFDKIALHSRGHVAKIVTLGDYVDRGPNSRQIIERLINWSPLALKLVALKGNHEAMMWECCKNLSEMSWWIGNGGDQTILSYRQSAACGDVSCIPAAHLDWMASLPLMHVDQHRVYVHAGVDPAVALHHRANKPCFGSGIQRCFRKASVLVT